MRCTSCDGTGNAFDLMRQQIDEACQSCDGTGRAPDDEFEAKLREAVAKIGMVYFVRDDVNHRIKIGAALNPLERLRALQTGSSVPLRLMAICSGGRAEERQFHAIWPNRRLIGEWFDDRDREISRIVISSLRSRGIIWPER